MKVLEFDNKSSRYIIIGLLLTITIGIISTSIVGKRDNHKFLTEQKLYNQALDSMRQNDFESAYSLISPLKEKYRESELVNYSLAVAASNSGEEKEGYIHMQRALDLNPYNVEDPMFMLQFAQILVMNEKYKEASEVLAVCKKFTPPENYPQYQETIQQLNEIVESHA